MTLRAARSTLSPVATGPQGFDAGALRAIDRVVDLAHFVLRRAEGHGACDVRGIAAHLAARVDEHDVARGELAVAGSSVRKRRGGAELDEASAVNAELLELLLEECRDLAFGHPAGELLVHGVDGERRVAGRFPDEGLLLGALDHPERVEESRRVSGFERRGGGEELRRGVVRRRALDADGSRLAERADRQRHRVLVLLPGHEVVDHGVAAVVLRLEIGRDEDRGALRQESESREALAAADREIRGPGEVGRGSEEESVEPACFRRSAQPRLPVAEDVGGERRWQRGRRP